ncbi:hypothetical protein ABET51_02910 [Metabacillus fastidiosus]|uniref:hypothetical protein n=1 Tax=Metabacillus fastidiosus TaxID=1458 RepID=UPI003D284D50
MTENTVSYNRYVNRAPDHEIWKPILDNQVQGYKDMVQRVRTAFNGKNKKEKGESLEELMTFVFSRFEDVADVIPNEFSGDNQIDHCIEFIDSLVPTFFHDYIGMRIIGESKNHNKTIGVREVSNLDELLRDNKSRLGIFSSYKTFSKGKKSMWSYAEGKRRKLLLSYNRYIIGFTIDELESLINNNFYTMIKQKIKNLQKELEDDYTEDEFGVPYHHRLYLSLKQLKNLDIIDPEMFEEGTKRLIEKFGDIEKEKKEP